MRHVVRLFAALALVVAVPALAGPADILESDHLRAGPISELSFLIGDYTVSETSFRPDGTVAERSEGGIVSVRPALDGSYIMLAARQNTPDEADEVLLWLITWHAERSVYVGRMYSGEDPDTGEASGTVTNGRLELVLGPLELPDGRELRARFTASATEDGIQIQVHQSHGEDWTLRAEEVWTRTVD